MNVTDSASASATAALSLTINAPALSITTSSLPAGTVGVAYTQGLNATGGTPPYTWSVTTLLLVPVLYSIAVLDLKIVKWEIKPKETL